MKKILVSIILLTNLCSVAFAECNFQLVNFGDSKTKLNEKINSILNIEEEFPLMLLPDQFGGELAMLPLDEICLDEKKLMEQWQSIYLLMINLSEFS